MPSSFLATFAAFASAAGLGAGGGDRTGPILDAGVFAGTPSALETGQLLGAAVDAWLSPDALRFGARLRLGAVGLDDQTWHIVHTELRCSALAAYAIAVGRAELSAGLALGAVTIREVRTRHQAERLAASGLDPETSGWAIGPQGSAEAAVRLYVFEGFALLLEGGPTLTWISIDQSASVRLGLSAAISVSYAF